LGSVCCVKRFTAGSRNFHYDGKRFADDEEVEMEVRKWLRQQSKEEVCATGFDALLEGWGKSINVSGGYVGK
jgi:hypothetical protein